MYTTLYDLLNQALFLGSATSGTIEGDALTFVTLAITLAVAAIPFKIIWNAIDFFTGGFRK